MKDKKLCVLVKKAAGGSKAAFVKLIECKAKEIVYLCIIEMGNRADGEDAAQEVFVRLHSGIRNLRAPEAFNVWLNRIIYFTCIEMKRTAMKDLGTVTQTLDETLAVEALDMLPEGFAEDNETKRILAQAVQNLPPHYKTCILLHYYQGLSYAQIAQAMNLTPDAVNNNLRMARKHLRLELEEALDRKKKSGQQPLYSAAPTLLAPVLRAALQHSANTLATPAVVQGFLSTTGLATAGVATTAGAKIAVCLVLAAGIAASGIAATTQLAAPPLPLAPGTVSSRLPQDDMAAVPGRDAEPVPCRYSVQGNLYIQPTEEADPACLRGLGGIRVELVNTEAPYEVLQSTYTAADGTGAFTLTGQAAGRYHLRVALPSGSVAQPGGSAVLDAATGTLAVQGQQTIVLDETDVALSGVELCLFVPTRVEGSLQFDDRAADATGWQIELLDPQGNTVATTGIAADGSYLFENPMVCQNGEYRLRILLPEGERGYIPEETTVQLYPGFGN